MKSLVILGSVLGAILLLLLTIASANTSFFARQYPLLLGLNGAMVAALVALVSYQVWVLWREYRTHTFGSRLKLRLMLAFVAMALAPGVLVYLVSFQFAERSIDSWFDVRIDKGLEESLNLGRTALDALQDEQVIKARSIANALSGLNESARIAQLDPLREQAGADTMSLYGEQGQIIANSGNRTQLLPSLPDAAQIKQANDSAYRAVEGDPEHGLTLHVLIRVAPSNGQKPALLGITRTVPNALAQSADSVQDLYRNYQELSLARVGIKRIFGLSLTLALLLALFTAIAFAYVISRRMSAPLSILAEGTQAVMAGDFTPRQTMGTHDELGILTRSFNQMTRQLDDARAIAERSRAETETARAYLEGVLAHLSAGVLTFSEDHVLQSVNQGALNILGADFAQCQHLALEAWPAQVPLREVLVKALNQGAEEWERQFELTRPDGAVQSLLIRGSRMDSGHDQGHVVVFDEITQLLSAQRAAAWGEVARRLAHEIKNPLTPIQLSAERLQHKLEAQLDSTGQDTLKRATQTIVSQVEAMKNLVNEFRDYARLPSPKLELLQLNTLVQDVMALYEDQSNIVVELANELPPVMGDPSQLRQVIHNLLQNAQDAQDPAKAEHAHVTVRTHMHGRRVQLIVSDQGSGFPPHILTRAFEPYVTTKTKGTGLGLAIVKKIVDEHQGDIQLSNLTPQGARVCISFPIAPQQTADAA